jgi:glucose-1-phosphate cytidylyltransferase
VKVVVLAGGLGTRISEESHLKPKPMIEIGERPILWHIMKIYSHYGFNEFIICLGYRGHQIKEYFNHYFLYESDVTIDFTKESHTVTHNHTAEPWKVTLVDTGGESQTGGRVKRIKKYVQNEAFMLTYGDGVSNVNLRDLLHFHNSHGRICTVTTIQPTGRFGVMDVDDNGKVVKFQEKPTNSDAWINSGFFVMNPGVFNYIHDDYTVLERKPMEKLAADKELMAYRHTGFWQCMDTTRDRGLLEHYWKEGSAPWKVWK